MKLGSRLKVGSSECILCGHVFRNLYLKLGTLRVDLLASRVSHQVAQYVAWKPDSVLGHRVIGTHFPHFCTEQNTTKPITHSNIDNTSWANTVVLSTSVGNANKETNSNTKFNLTLSRTKRESLSISAEQNSYVDGMAGLWEGLSLQGVSEKTTQLQSQSRRQSTLRNNESA